MSHLLLRLIAYVMSVDYFCSTHPPRDDALQWRHNGRGGVSNHWRLVVYSTVCSCADKRKRQSSASLAFVRGIHRWPVNSLYKGPVTRKMYPLMTSSWFITGNFMKIMDWTWCHGPGLYQVYISNWFGTGCFVVFGVQWPLLLTWFNFNPSMDK